MSYSQIFIIINIIVTHLYGLAVLSPADGGPRVADHALQYQRLLLLDGRRVGQSPREPVQDLLL